MDPIWDVLMRHLEARADYFRLFDRHRSRPDAWLKVEALYPGLLGAVQVAKLGVLQGTAAWQPSPVMTLLLSNLLATLSLDRTSIAFRFTPLDGFRDIYGSKTLFQAFWALTLTY